MQRLRDRILVKALGFVAKAGLADGWLTRLAIVKRISSNAIVNFYCYCTEPRPRAHALDADYTNWTGLTDKTITSRHLPPNTALERPPLEEVAAVWRRSEEIPSEGTSMIFTYFAQWLTDSFMRTKLDDTTYNHSTHQLDLCQIYSLDRHKTRMLRTLEGGRLKSQQIDGQEYPVSLFDPEKINGKEADFGENPEHYVREEFVGLYPGERLKRATQRMSIERKSRMFAVGLEHGNSTAGQLALNTIWMREHNRLAAGLMAHEGLTDDEEIFQKARSINIVQYLRVILRDYIRHISVGRRLIEILPGEAEKHPWYRENRVSAEFNLLYRWHSLVPEKFGVEGHNHEPMDFVANPDILRDIPLGELFTAASRAKAGQIGLGNTHGMFFSHNDADGNWVEGTLEKTIRFGRDANLGSFNDYRRAFSLEPLASFEELTDKTELQVALRRLYGSIDNLEWHTGIFAEKPREGSILGELMYRMVAYDALTHALTNPLLSKNIYNEATFTAWGMGQAEGTDTLQQVVERNLGGVPAVVSFDYLA